MQMQIGCVSLFKTILAHAKGNTDLHMPLAIELFYSM